MQIILLRTANCEVIRQKTQNNTFWGLQIHFCPSPNPDFDVSWEKMCKNWEKSTWKEREKVFVLANC